MDCRPKSRRQHIKPSIKECLTNRTNFGIVLTVTNKQNVMKHNDRTTTIKMDTCPENKVNDKSTTSQQYNQTLNRRVFDAPNKSQGHKR